MNFSTAFVRAVNFVMGPNIEGELSMDPDDPGNWTGGKKGVGELKGTKYGISAKAYPDLEIQYLSREKAREIYWKDYWNPIRGDQLPPRVAIVVFDCAVNQGVDIAARLLQTALKVNVDGIIGQHTVAAARTVEPTDLVASFLAYRALRYAKSDQWKAYGNGWMRRLFYACTEAAR